MKKIILLSLCSLLIVHIWSQTENVFVYKEPSAFGLDETPETFQGVSGSSRILYFFNDVSTPSDWIISNAGGGAIGDWSINNALSPETQQYFLGPMQATSSGGNFIFIDAGAVLFSDDPGPQNAFITTAIPFNITGAGIITVQFEQRYRAFNTDQTFVMISTDNGSTWITKEVNTEIAPNALTTATQSINFNVAGATGCKVRFHFFAPFNPASPVTPGGYGWGLDDIKVFDAATNNMVLTEINRGRYSKYPLGQERPIALSGRALNDGATAQAGIKLNVTVNGTNLGNSGTTSLPPFGTDVLLLNNTFTPSGLGVKNLTFSVSQTATDEVPANNIKSSSIEVTQNTFSRDHNMYSGIGFGSYSLSGLTQLGTATKYELSSAANATSVSAVLDSSSEAGAVLQAIILKRNGSDFDGVAISEHILLPSEIPAGPGNNPVSVKFNFDEPIPLAAGEYYIAITHTDANASVAYDVGFRTGDVLVLLQQGNNATWSVLNQAIEEPMIRLHLNEETVGVEENVMPTMSIFPNPTSEVLHIATNEIPQNAIKIHTLDGREVYAESFSGSAASPFHKILNVSTFPKGLYIVTVIGNKKSIQQKFVVK